jgi:hypothetical protein
VRNDPEAPKALVFALQAASVAQQNPWGQARWMLISDFLSASVPILPFVFLPTPHLIEAGAHAVKLQFAHGFQNLVAFHQAIFLMLS